MTTFSSLFSRQKTKHYEKDSENTTVKASLYYYLKFLYLNLPKGNHKSTISRYGACAALAMAMLGHSLPANAAGQQQPNPPAKTQQQALPFGVLGSIEFRTNNFAGITQWSKTIAKVKAEQTRYAQCDLRGVDCGVRVNAWRKQLTALQGYRKVEQLAKLNRFINHAQPYREDYANFKKPDHWTSPIEFLKYAGDCEDFAIIKFFSLLELGFTNDQLRIVVVNDQRRGLPHAVLSVTLNNGEVYILDSLRDRPVTHERSLHYKPIYSVNLNTRWAHISTPQIQQKFASYTAHKKVRQFVMAPGRPAVKASRKSYRTAGLRPSIIDTNLKPASKKSDLGWDQEYSGFSN